MKDLISLHNEAMDKALKADSILREDPETAQRLYNEAFLAEKEAAFMAEENGNPEPGLSILFRSAATLALQCGLLREAERLVAHALANNPTTEIAIELRDLLQTIYSDDRFAAVEQPDELSFRLSVPKSEEKLFNTIIKRMGWTFSNFHRQFGKVAVF